MNRHIYICLSLMLALWGFTAEQASAQGQRKSKSPFGEVFSLPCGDYKDNSEQFAAVGIFKGSADEKGEVHRNALANAKAIILEKYQHTYNGMISEYSSYSSSGGNSNIATKLERAGDAVITAALNDANEVCTMFSEVTDDNKVECYVAIVISKGELARNVAKKVSDTLSDKEKKDIDYSEQNYRKRMEERMGRNK